MSKYYEILDVTEILNIYKRINVIFVGSYKETLKQKVIIMLYIYTYNYIIKQT